MKKWYQKEGAESEVALSACVRLARNLRGIPFPAGLDDAGKRKVGDKIKDAVFDENSAVSHIFRYVDLESLRDGEAVAMAERRLVKAGFLAGRNGRGLLVSEDESACVMINGDDHFLLQAQTPGFSLEEAYAEADRLDTILDKSLHFAFDPELGYLTCSPALLGTGMVASVDLHLPALADSGAAARVAANLLPLGMLLRGVGNPAGRPHGSIFRLSNRMTLGLSEREAVTNLKRIAGQIIAQERAARNRLIQGIAVQDTAGRSLGILKTARLLGFGEFLDLISVVRFGMAAGFLPRTGYGTIGDLLMRVQPANLNLEAGRRLTEDEEKAIRADVVREAFAGRKDGGAGNEGNG